MLDKWLKAIVQRLDAHKAEVIAQRATIERKMAGDEAPSHVERPFENSEGFTTSLPVAAVNAQNEYARVRRQFEQNGGMAAFSLAVELLVARERRDETAAALKKHEAAETLRQAEGVHRLVKALYKRMKRLGVEPRHVANIRYETLALICDLIRWDGHDPMIDPHSPMPDVFAIYASRLILMPGQFGEKSRSQPGIPTVPVRSADPHYFMFNELTPVVAVDEVEAVAEAAVPESARPAAVAPLDDDARSMCDIGRQGGEVPPAASTDATDASSSVAEPEPVTSTAPAPIDEYALPPQFTEHASTLHAAAEQLMRGGEWDFELNKAASFWAGQLTTQRVIDQVSAEPDDPQSTPFRYFVDAARAGGLNGIEAGREAYRAATCKRLMLEIATAPAWKDARAKMGLP